MEEFTREELEIIEVCLNNTIIGASNELKVTPRTAENEGYINSVNEAIAQLDQLIEKVRKM